MYDLERIGLYIRREGSEDRWLPVDSPTDRRPTDRPGGAGGPAVPPATRASSVGLNGNEIRTLSESVRFIHRQMTFFINSGQLQCIDPIQAVLLV